MPPDDMKATAYWGTCLEWPRPPPVRRPARPAAPGADRPAVGAAARPIHLIRSMSEQTGRGPAAGALVSWAEYGPSSLRLTRTPARSERANAACTCEKTHFVGALYV